MTELKQMRGESEIQRAHDILLAVLLHEIPGIEPFPEQAKAMTQALDALCWVLGGHDHSPTFATNLARLEAAVEAEGYKLVQRSQ